MPRPGLLSIISGPSGVGKTTLTHAVVRELGVLLSVSMTTRPKAPHEVDGKDYRFVDVSTFSAARESRELLEWAEVYGNYYGTPRRPVEEAIAAGRPVILEIDVQGAINIKKAMPGAFAIFVMPPSEEVLLERLRSRKREDEATIQKRFSKAKAEIARARESGVYGAFVCNDVLDRAVAEAVGLIRGAMGR